jgi:hypothetical protein
MYHVLISVAHEVIRAACGSKATSNSPCAEQRLNTFLRRAEERSRRTLENSAGFDYSNFEHFINWQHYMNCII